MAGDHVQGAEIDVPHELVGDEDGEGDQGALFQQVGGALHRHGSGARHQHGDQGDADGVQSPGELHGDQGRGRAQGHGDSQGGADEHRLGDPRQGHAQQEQGQGPADAEEGGELIDWHAHEQARGQIGQQQQADGQGQHQQRLADAGLGAPDPREQGVAAQEGRQ